MTTENLEDLLVPELKEKYYKTERDKWFPSECCHLHRPNYIACKLANESWIRQPCCTSEYIKQTRTPGLFKEESFSPFNPNTCNLGTNVFYNHTQQQVKDLQSSWCCKPGSYKQEAQQARTITEQRMRGCKKQAKNVFKNQATQQSNEVLETENPSRN